MNNNEKLLDNLEKRQLKLIQYLLDRDDVEGTAMFLGFIMELEEVLSLVDKKMDRLKERLNEIDSSWQQQQG